MNILEMMIPIVTSPIHQNNNVRWGNDDTKIMISVSLTLLILGILMTFVELVRGRDLKTIFNFTDIDNFVLTYISLILMVSTILGWIMFGIGYFIFNLL